MAAPTFSISYNLEPQTLGSDVGDICLEHLFLPNLSVKWKINTLYCDECRENLLNYLKDKSDKELIKISFMQPELRPHIREYLQNRK